MTGIEYELLFDKDDRLTCPFYLNDRCTGNGDICRIHKSGDSCPIIYWFQRIDVRVHSITEEEDDD